MQSIEDQMSMDNIHKFLYEASVLANHQLLDQSSSKFVKEKLTFYLKHLMKLSQLHISLREKLGELNDRISHDNTNIITNFEVINYLKIKMNYI